MSECIGEGCTDKSHPEKTENAIPEGPKVTHVQAVIVTLADGRRAAFMGPMFVSKAELMLKPPVISEVVICEPRPIKEPKIEEAKDGTEKKDEAGVDGLQSPPAGLAPK